MARTSAESCLDDDILQPLGTRIADLRRRSGLTLTQLCDVCGFSEATLSRIENGQSHVSARHLFLMARHMGVDITDFFQDDAIPLAKGLRSITRAGDTEQRTLQCYVSEVLHTDLSRKDMHPAINHVTASSIEEAGGLAAHKGEEFIYVISGAIEIHSDLYEATLLRQGDSIYFDATMAHAYVNAGDNPACILVVVGPHSSAPHRQAKS